MASKRPNKQQRQRQNRQQREARRARSVRAGEATAIARGERQGAEPTASTRGTGKAAGAKTASAKAAAQSGRKQRYSIPGQRAIVMAFLFTLVSAATLLFSEVPQVVEEGSPVLEEIDEDRIDERDTERGTVRFDAKLLEVRDPAVAAGILVTPIAITGAAVWFAKRPQRSMVWTMAMIAMAAYVFFIAGGAYGTLVLPSLIALAVGGFQSRRAESKERLAELRAKKAARADGEVIDVDATEADAVEDLTDDPTTDAADEDVAAEQAGPVSEDDRR